MSGSWIDWLSAANATRRRSPTSKSRFGRTSEVFTRTITDADQWQRVEARGTFDADHQFVVRYRSNGDADGYEIVTPLHTATGTVLVDRGFIPLVHGAQIPSTAPAPPAGEVTLVGHVRRSERGRRAATTPVNNQMRLINSDAIAATLPYPSFFGLHRPADRAA